MDVKEDNAKILLELCLEVTKARAVMVYTETLKYREKKQKQHGTKTVLRPSGLLPRYHEDTESKFNG